MATEWNFNIRIWALLIPILSYAQGSFLNDERLSKQRGLNFSVQSVFLLPYDDGDRLYLNTDYELEENSRVFGINAQLDYFTGPQFALGIGFGREHVNQPDFVYYPVYLNATLLSSDNKNTLYMKTNFGTHLGDLKESGFLFRAGIGYRLSIFKRVMSNFEFTYSFQNIKKSFENSGRTSTHYNIESLGFTIGLHIQ